MAGISSRSSSLPNLAEKVEKVDLDKLGASCAEPGCHALQSAGAKCIYRKPNAEYGRFYHDPRKAGEFKIATKFPSAPSRLAVRGGFQRHRGFQLQTAPFRAFMAREDTLPLVCLANLASTGMMVSMSSWA
eukprot:TRINITY_DN4834_c0_g1_i1.p1 TRINITY_DN4834_c0_g1~~TRINITY_DN4834_c0_g1_i1.p1  ORF type:complete len:131 (+),score=23.99 TRINITY_DN4834_c0_g1_i1:72-464(+)